MISASSPLGAPSLITLGPKPEDLAPKDLLVYLGTTVLVVIMRLDFDSPSIQVLLDSDGALAMSFVLLPSCRSPDTDS